MSIYKHKLPCTNYKIVQSFVQYSVRKLCDKLKTLHIPCTKTLFVQGISNANWRLNNVFLVCATCATHKKTTLLKKLAS